jgi:non-heme chloroperoxidase
MSTPFWFDMAGYLGVPQCRVRLPDGLEMCYWDTGAGPTLLFVPGWTFSSEIFIHQLRHLSSRYRVIAIDPRSQGQSSVTVHGNEYATHAADLGAFVEALDLRDVVFIGWSAGAAETWGYVRLRGLDRVRAHICIDLPPKCLSSSETDWVEGDLAGISSAVMAMANRSDLRSFTAAYARGVMVQRTLTDAELRWIAAQSERTPQWAALSLFAYLMFTDFRPEATLLDEHRPSLFVIAEHWAARAVPYIRERWPRSQTAVLGGHMMFWEHPEAFNHLVDEFVTALSAAPSAV